MYIVQGDHGIPIPFTVQKLSASENIEGATVEVAIHRGTDTFTRAATIIDAAKGECEFVLTSSDLTIFAKYEWQWTAYLADGRIFSGKKREFFVSERLLAGSSGGETVPVIVPFARVEELEALEDRVSTIETEGTGGGSVLVFQTLADLQAAYPNGVNQPAWVVSENAWYYWEGVIVTDTTAPTLTITAGGTFTGTKSVTMSVNETADIYYTLDGSTPTISSTKYTSPLSISATTTLKAFAKDTAGNSSAIQTVTYTLDATPPADTTAPDNVTNLAYSSLAQTSLTLTWAASASSDVASYDVYNGATLLANVTGTTYNVTGLSASTQYTFTVKAKDAANNVASGSSVTVTTSAPADTTAPVLTITPAATFTTTQTVTMTTNETANIYYTLDDTDPKTSGTKLTYTAPLTLTATDTIKAYARDTAGNESAVQTVTYTKSNLPAGYVALEDFSTYTDGAITGKSKWQLVEGTNATVTAGVLNVDASWNTAGKKHGLQFNEVRSNGVYKILVKGGCKVMFGWNKPDGTLSKWVVWKNTANTTTYYQWGSLVDPTLTTKTPNLTLVDPSTDHWIEVTMNGGNVGDIIELRSWGVSGSRPSVAGVSYTIQSGDPILASGEFVFNSFDSTSFGIKQFIVTQLGV